MLIEVLIGEFTSSVKLELNSKYKNLLCIDSGGAPEQSLLLLHKKSLINSSNTKCLYNLEDISDKLLIDLLNYHIENDVIWCFGKLAKNTKLYKRLDVVSTIHNLPGEKLDSKSKTNFVNSYLIDNNIPREYAKYLKDKTTPSRSILVNECIKLKNAYGVVDDSILDKCIIDYSSDKDVMEFINHLFNNKLVETYRLAQKISVNNSQVVAIILLKKIKSLIYFSKGMTKEAQSTWYTPDFYLKPTVTLAKDVGYDSWLSLYTYVFENIYDIYSTKPLYNRLLDFMAHIRSKVFV